MEALATYLGLRVNTAVDGVPEDVYQYDGAGTICVPHNEDRASNALHEIAHYLVCEDRKGTPNYGFPGRGPNGGKSHSGLGHLAGYGGVEEECRASILGILLERDLGMNASSTYLWHNWGDEWLLVRTYVRDLLRAGHAVWRHGRLRTKVFVDFCEQSV